MWLNVCFILFQVQAEIKTSTTVQKRQHKFKIFVQ